MYAKANMGTRPEPLTVVARSKPPLWGYFVAD
jgi:hypothetical protein